MKSYPVKVKESDLYISTRGDFSAQAEAILRRSRERLEEYIASDKKFSNSLTPVKPSKKMPPVARAMAAASEKSGVGPMAAVAGAIAAEVGRGLLKLTGEVIVENGGDIYIKLDRTARAAVFAGESPLNMKIAVEIDSSGREIALCSSSGTVGHSLSGGNADAALCLSEDAALADAAATALANRVVNKDDIEKALNFCKRIKGIDGCLVICKDMFGAAGKIKLCRI